MAKKSTKFLIGTSGWTYPDWKGLFYPKDLPKKNWFDYYQSHFPIVELNATFYRFFSDKVFIKWREQAKDDFKYIIKVNRTITHINYLKNSKRLIRLFCRKAALLEDKLALILLQLPPRMPYDLPLLKKTILSFDDPKKIVVEFRDKKWLTPETKALLKELGCVFCAADSPKMQLVNWVTSDRAYIRLHGRKVWFDYKYKKSELEEVAKLAKRMVRSGAKTVYILLNNDYYSYSVQNATYLKKLLHCHTNLTAT